MSGIKFIGRNTQKNHKWEVIADSCEELYKELVNKGIISEYDYDPVYKYILDDKYDEIMDEADERCQESGDLYSHLDAICEERGIDTTLTDEQYMEIIQREDGNAYYQAFVYADDDVQYPGLTQNDLEFDEDGELIWEHDVKVTEFPAIVKISVGCSSVEIDTDSLEYNEDEIEDMVEADIERICEEMEFSGEHLFRSDWEKVHEELHTYYFNRI